MPVRTGEEAMDEHYTRLTPEPIEVTDAWGLDYYEGNVLKYLARWRHKNGVEDLQKALFYLNRLIERESSGSNQRSGIDTPGVGTTSQEGGSTHSPWRYPTGP